MLNRVGIPIEVLSQFSLIFFLKSSWRTLNIFTHKELRDAGFLLFYLCI